MSKENITAEVYLLLATLYRGAPSKALLDHMAALAFEQGKGEMPKAWAALQLTSGSLTPLQVEEEYQDLFIGIGRGEVVPFASWHRTGSLMETPLAHIRQDLLQLGFEREEKVKEPEDHISALCEVMALLVDESPDKARAFFNRHISPWYTGFIRQIEEAPSSHFYLAVAQLTMAFFTIQAVSYAEFSEQREANTVKVVKNFTHYEQLNTD